MRKFSPGRLYVEIDFSMNPGGFNWNRTNTGGGIDFISVDGRERWACVDFAKEWIRAHGGILLLDNSDRPGMDGTNASIRVPPHWLKYDSSNEPHHIDSLKTDRWLRNGQTTLWITRDPRCMEKHHRLMNE